MSTWTSTHASLFVKLRIAMLSTGSCHLISNLCFRYQHSGSSGLELRCYLSWYLLLWDIDGRFHDFYELKVFSLFRLSAFFWLLLRLFILTADGSDLVADLFFSVSLFWLHHLLDDTTSLGVEISAYLFSFSSSCTVVRHLLGADNTLVEGWIDIVPVSVPFFSLAFVVWPGAGYFAFRGKMNVRLCLYMYMIFFCSPAMLSARSREGHYLALDGH
jgi:hypothetical protein